LRSIRAFNSAGLMMGETVARAARLDCPEAFGAL